MTVSNDFISIIIPTYNRGDQIRNTILCCAAQDYPKDRFEIIVADNNSTDNTKGVIEELQKSSDADIKYLFEPRQGAHYARNLASKQARGDFLYFTDDDMLPKEDVLRRMVKVFDVDSNIAEVGGRVLPKWEFDPPEWLTKYFYDGTLSLIDKQEKLIVADFDIGIYSCHQMIKREILFECGGFNPDIAKDTLIGNGETGLNIKIINAGHLLAYTSEAVSYHAIPRSRMTQRYINSRYGNQGNCDSFTLHNKHKKSKDQYLRMVLKNHFPEVIRKFALSFRKQFSGDSSWRVDRAIAHYYYHRMTSDLKLAFNEDWRNFTLRENYLDD